MKAKRKRQTIHNFLRKEKNGLPSFFACLFAYCLGGSVYPLLELAFRKHSHWSMSVAGGLSMLAIHCINSQLPLLGIPWKCLLCATVITEIELILGSLVNRKRTVWDYSRLPLHFRGQICLPYFLLWNLLSFPAIGISNRLLLWLP